MEKELHGEVVAEPTAFPRVVVAPDKSIGTFMIYIEERDEDGLGAETWVEVDFGINDDADGQLATVLSGLLYEGKLMPEWALVDGEEVVDVDE